MDNNQQKQNSDEKQGPLQSGLTSPPDKPKADGIKPMYEKEWDDAEAVAGDLLEKRRQKKKEDV